jgi:transcription antitermination factor NusG
MIWHAIRVASPLEFRVRDELHHGGVAAIVPGRVVLGRKPAGGTTAGKARRQTKLVPVISGYVFAGFRGFPSWNTLAGIRGWIGPVGFDGSPAQLTAKDVALLQSFDRSQDEEEPGLSRRRVEVGDRVPYRIGRHVELRALVKRLSGGKALLEVELFGSVREVTVASESIEAAA